MKIGPAVGVMQNGTHKYFRRIFCNNYPVNYRKKMVEAIEGTPEERRRQVLEERSLHFRAINKLEAQKAEALAAHDFGAAMMYHNQIQDLNEKWESQHVDDYA